MCEILSKSVICEYAINDSIWRKMHQSMYNAQRSVIGLHWKVSFEVRLASFNSKKVVCECFKYNDDTFFVDHHNLYQEVELVTPVTHGGSVKFLPAV